MLLIYSCVVAYLFYKLLTWQLGNLSIKEFAALYYLKYLKRGHRSRLDNYDYTKHEIKKVNLLPPDEEAVLEYRNDDPNKREGVFLFGSNSKGDRLISKITVQNEKAVVYIQFISEGKTYTLPRNKIWKVPKTDHSCFAAAGIRIRCLMPFRKWRVSFNGILREEGDKRDVHVKFRFLWIASSGPCDSQDVPKNILAKYLAGLTWDEWLPNIEMLPETEQSFDQSGNLIGTVSIDGSEEKEVLLWGGRNRFTENFNNTDIKSKKEVFVYMREGEYVHMTELNYGDNKKKLVYGFVVFCNSFEGPMEEVQFEQYLNSNLSKVVFTSQNHKFELYIMEAFESVEISNEFGECQNYSFSEAKLNDDNKGFAMYIETTLSKTSAYGSKPIQSVRAQTDLVLDISNDVCKNVEFTGGKGSSLAVLTDISRKNQTFSVPKGFVVTTLSYEKFSTNNQLKKVIKDIEIESIAWGKTKGDLKTACEKTVAAVGKMSLPEVILNKVEEKMKIFAETTLFAIRSSASGEDSEEMSAAGQMDTFLGIQGLKQVSEAIVKCWASQFSHTAIQYKKQNGQVLNSPMAVVVQEIIPAEQAGVMFTCNPVTGNPEYITITANYGLGESVVSATAEPDTIVIKRDVDGNVVIDSVTIGRKSKKTALAETGGVNEVSVDDDQSKKCCVCDEDLLKLATLGHQLEDDFGTPLDIEWALIGGKIHLLQARPVTTFDRETDFELIHETDAHMRTEYERMTKANVGEVMPGATSELGASVMIRMMDLTFQDHWLRKDQASFPWKPYIQIGIITSSKHMLFNTDGLYRVQKDKERSGFTRGTEIGLFGRIVDDDELLDIAIRRNQFYPGGNVTRTLFYMIRNLFLLERHLQQQTKFIDNYKMNMDRNLPSEPFFYQLLSKVFEICPHNYCHTEATIASSMYSMTLLSILAKANNDKWDVKVFSDFALLLSKCKEVLSADVPFALQELAKTINDCISSEKFRKMSIEEAQTWLETSNTTASTHFKDFLRKHGHRCVKEFDIAISPWRINPAPLVRSLQEMVKSVTKRDRTSSIISEVIQQLKITLTWKSRFLLKLAVPFCKTAVGRRERSKSNLIKTIDYFRKEFVTLSEKMVQEGRLPESSLLFYLSHYEVSLLLKTRSPKLIQKAIRRKALHPIVDNYRFPEITVGLPKPSNLQATVDNVSTNCDLILKGTPVSQGVVKAKVRVANNLDEAANIEPGEILIAYSTDIGWSPYFPVLSGVVTELGGLISHGAVVAREYGLPCVVALHGATSMFKTGEIAILDGNRGTLQRVLE